jgi:nitrate reductase assembly molybdenum cofactor insertion protein NarJ
MDAQPSLGEREIQLARDAAEWRLLSLLFECPSPSSAEQIKSLLRDVTDAELRAAAQASLVEASQGQFHHAFGPGGPAPPREATYHQSVELGYLMSEIETYYEAFAFKPQSGEAPDHVGVETNFIAYLRFKEAYALARGEEEQAAVSAEAAARFMREHLATIASPLAGFLADSGISYLAKAGAVLLRRVGPPATVKPGLPVLAPAPLDDSPECG